MNWFWFILGFLLGWFCYGGAMFALAMLDGFGAVGPTRIGDDHDET